MALALGDFSPGKDSFCVPPGVGFSNSYVKKGDVFVMCTPGGGTLSYFVYRSHWQTSILLVRFRNSWSFRKERLSL